MNEEKVNKGKNLTFKKTKILYEKADKSIFEIIKDKEYGSGFLCKIKNPNNFDGIYLITNNHVIIKDMLIYRENIEIKLNNKT